jgi:F-type H+-transporting ATPase subunit b
MHIDWWTLALQTVNVLVLLWILSRFFFRPVMDIVAKRQAEAARLLSDAASVQTQANAERDRLMEEARKAAAAEKTILLDHASREIQKLRSEAQAAQARERIEDEKAVLEHARELSLDIARRLLGRVPPATAFNVFLEELCREVQAMSADAKRKLAPETGQSVDIVTAAALSPEEAGNVRDAVSRALGSRPLLEFRVDAALIAGIELHCRNMIVRNNWRADLDRIAEDLARDEHHSAA